MAKTEFPPFYVGQKVVILKTCTTNGLNIKKGSVVTASGCVKCSCGTWMVGIVECPGFCETSEHKKSHLYYHPGDTNLHGEAKHFAPIIENFQSISLEKILEEETKLISVN